MKQIHQIVCCADIIYQNFYFFIVFTGKAWDNKVHDNVHSFGEIYDINSDVCPSKLQGLIAQAHDAAWQTL